MARLPLLVHDELMTNERGKPPSGPPSYLRRAVLGAIGGALFATCGLSRERAEGNQFADESPGQVIVAGAVVGMMYVTVLTWMGGRVGTSSVGYYSSHCVAMALAWVVAIALYTQNYSDWIGLSIAAGVGALAGLSLALTLRLVVVDQKDRAK